MGKRAASKSSAETAAPPRAEELDNHYDQVVNWQLWGPAPNEVSTHISRMLRLYAHYRDRLLKEAGGHAWLKHRMEDLRERDTRSKAIDALLPWLVEHGEGRTDA